MKKISRFLGRLFLIMGLSLCVLGVLALPDGGLMFALPYFFLVPGIALMVCGGFMIVLARSSAKTKNERSDVATKMDPGESQ